MTSLPTGRRLLLAFLVAPLAAPAAFVLTAVGVEMIGSSATPSVQSAFSLALGVFAVGGPVAYAATLAVGAPIYFVLRALGLVRRWTVWLGAAIIGAAVAMALSPRLAGDLFSVKLPWWAGALLGVVSAEAFWRLGEVDRPRTRGIQ
ncbi:MAG TPA: hypothetical protein VKA54_05290 [Gemmatimonadaceae bacterium]|nr:hypothetical protein [Gemmatimonadaceae bacterium]